MGGKSVSPQAGPIIDEAAVGQPFATARASAADLTIDRDAALRCCSPQTILDADAWRTAATTFRTFYMRSLALAGAPSLSGSPGVALSCLLQCRVTARSTPGAGSVPQILIARDSEWHCGLIRVCSSLKAG